MLNDYEEDVEDAQTPLHQLVAELPDYVVERQDFEIIEQIGDGGFGKVFKAKHKKTGRLCAFKDVYEKRLYVDNFRKYVSEIRTMARCHCMCTVELIGFTVRPPYSIVTAFQSQGSVDMRISNTTTNPHAKKSKTTSTPKSRKKANG